MTRKLKKSSSINIKIWHLFSEVMSLCSLKICFCYCPFSPKGKGKNVHSHSAPNLNSNKTQMEFIAILLWWACEEQAWKKSLFHSRMRCTSKLIFWIVHWKEISQNRFSWLPGNINGYQKILKWSVPWLLLATSQKHINDPANNINTSRYIEYFLPLCPCWLKW